MYLVSVTGRMGAGRGLALRKARGGTATIYKHKWLHTQSSELPDLPGLDLLLPTRVPAPFHFEGPDLRI